jgi:hypothetical protein
MMLSHPVLTLHDAEAEAQNQALNAFICALSIISNMVGDTLKRLAGPDSAGGTPTEATETVALPNKSLID